jgi:phytoene desaturase (3,4-didehydrolycopene-forming)
LRSDPAAAPEGKDAMVVLVPIGSLLVEENRTEADWTELVAKAKKQVIEVMEGRLGLTGLNDMIVWEHVNTPVSCELKDSRTRG